MKSTFICDSVNNTSDGKSTATMTGVLPQDAPHGARKGFVNIVGDTDGFPIQAGKQYDIEVTETPAP